MDSNVTWIRFSGHMELRRFRSLYFSCLLLVFLLIVFSNGSVVITVLLHRKLHRPMYAFIAALLLNSVLYSLVIYPKLLLDFLSEDQLTSYASCLLQCFCYYTINAAEFLLLAAMAYDRFLAICRPLRYTAIMASGRVAACVAAAWLLPACRALCRFDLPGIFCNNLIYRLHCVSSPALAAYGSVALVNLTALPVLFILYTYARILLVAYRGGADVRRKASRTCLPHLLVLVNHTCAFAADVVFVKLEADLSGAVRLSVSLQVIVLHPLVNPVIYGVKTGEIARHARGSWEKVKGRLADCR